jgi:pimeloyl-ACP methyl ester carboxylesterase
VNAFPIPILLLPGMDGTGDLFDFFIAEAPPAFRPLVVSLPPRGSYEELVEAVRFRIPDEPFVIVGESYSGPLALRIASAADTQAVAVVLCNSFIASPYTPILRVLPWTLLLSKAPSPAMIRRLMAGRNAPAELIDAIQAAIARTPADVLPARLREVFALDEAKTLEAIRLPILYLRGTRDALVPESAVERIVRVAPHVVRRDIPAPHLLLQTAPKQAWSAIEEFVATVRP